MKDKEKQSLITVWGIAIVVFGLGYAAYCWVLEDLKKSTVGRQEPVYKSRYTWGRS